jgi:hypothetical protein
MEPRVPSFKRNVVPDRLDLRDRPYVPSLTKAPPASFSALERLKAAPLDQEQTSACTGFALSACMNLLLQRAGRAKEGPVSPHMLYSMARRYDEYESGPDEDTGSSLRGAMKGWYKHGACAADLWKALDMPPPSSDPSRDWWLDAVRRPLGAYCRVDTRSVTDMHVAIHEAGALFASAICHEGWMEGIDVPAGRRRGWAIPFRKAAPNDGGHAFAIVGYEPRGFLILNSWGERWGDGGLAILTYEDWLEHAMDCWVAQLGVSTQQHLEIAQSPSLRTDGAGAVKLSGDPVLRNREIGPFVIDMENNGRLSRTGDFRTQESDVKALVTDHLQRFRKVHGLQGQVIDIAIYAHGGLTGEDTAAETAARWIPALYEKGVFPIFLMWETDLVATVLHRCQDLIAELAAQPRPTAGLRDQLQRFWNTRVERALVEPGSWIWDEMKQNAEAIAHGKESGARILYEASKGIIVPGRARLHLIGHSAGAIVHSHVVQALAQAGWEFETITFMAPAVTVETFQSTVAAQMKAGSVKRYHQLHLTDEMEQQDSTCRAICGYGRSLLYLVSESFEHGRRADILGIERHFQAMVAALPAEVRQRMASWSAPLAGSLSTTHGGFDDDDQALETVITLIKKEAVPAAATPARAGMGAIAIPSDGFGAPEPVAARRGDRRGRGSGSGRERTSASRAPGRRSQARPEKATASRAGRR